MAKPTILPKLALRPWPLLSASLRARCSGRCSGCGFGRAGAGQHQAAIAQRLQQQVRCGADVRFQRQFKLGMDVAYQAGQGKA